MNASARDRGKQIVAGLVVLSAVVLAASFLHGDGQKGEHWTFLDSASLAELGLVAHGSSGGPWGFEDHEPATGGRALANHEGEPDAGPALLVALTPLARDIKTTTRCKVVSMSTRAEAFADSPAACGVVFRFIDEANYWTVRADAGAKMLEAAVVIAGAERVIARIAIPAAVRVGAWIDLSVEVRGDVVRAELGGAAPLVVDAAIVPGRAGSVGLWAPAGTTVLFDHFAIETLTSAPRSLEILPLLGRRPG